MVAVHVAGRHAVPAAVGGDAERHVGDGRKLVAVLQAKGHIQCIQVGAAVVDVSRMGPREAVAMLSQHVCHPACDITRARARPRTAPSRALLAMKMPFVASTMLTCTGQPRGGRSKAVSAAHARRAQGSGRSDTCQRCPPAVAASSTGSSRFGPSS